ncbi:hypothetical protein O181_025176 [Austropuccinia psidii MF-1]|uniref:Uncharacterized protein n=1 Tax=Austropuccinia psidii MF-1 TaxID=1389203 RepID=A0A9Q3CI20_9BASI|nr:hypothetical protein [Austropuccinia psidii MF-1]
MFAHRSQKTLPPASRFPTLPRHWTINDWAQVVWTDESAFELGKKVDQPHGMGGILCGDASAVGLSQWANDLDRDGSASLLTRPASIHSLDGAGPLVTWSRTDPTDGG